MDSKTLTASDNVDVLSNSKKYPKNNYNKNSMQLMMLHKQSMPSVNNLEVNSFKSLLLLSKPIK